MDGRRAPYGRCRFHRRGVDAAESCWLGVNRSTIARPIGQVRHPLEGRGRPVAPDIRGPNYSGACAAIFETPVRGLPLAPPLLRMGSGWGVFRR